MRVIAIVEGHGEVEAVPILIRRIAEEAAPEVYPEIPRPIRVKRHLLLKPGELERTVELAARQTGPGDFILILLDADDDCPRDLAAAILARARAVRADRRFRAVVAKSEYEAWFLASATSIAGRRGIDAAVTAPDDPESIRSAKGWLSSRMPEHSPYRETLDQPALTAVFDLQSAKSAPSFDKLYRDVSSMFTDLPG